VHHWCLSCSGIYLAKSSYEEFFQGSIQFWPCDRIWNTRAPSRCHFFMWIVTHKCCWTADQLENGDSHILTDVLTVRRLKKLLIICLLIVCLQGNSGHHFYDSLAYNPCQPRWMNYPLRTGGTRPMMGSMDSCSNGPIP